MAWWIGLASVYRISFAAKWEYAGFCDNWDWTRTVVAVGAFIVITPMFPSKVTVRWAAAHFAVALIVVPTSVLYTFGVTPLEVLLITTGAVAVMVIGMLLISIPEPTLPIQVGASTGAAIAVALVVCVAAASIAILGASSLNFKPAEVYEHRSDVKESTPILLNYGWSASGKVALPFLMVYGLARRRFWAVGVSLAMAVLLFGISSHKSMMLVVVSGATYLLTKELCSRPLRASVALVLIGAVVCAIAGFGFSDGAPETLHLTASVLYRRAIMVPSYLNGVYIEVYSHMEPVFWSGSRLGQWIGAEAPLVSAPELVGEWGLRGSGTWANTGWIGSGYSHAQLTGVAVYSLLVAAYVAVADSLACKHGMAATIGLTTVPILTMLCSSDVLTSLGSHGGALLIGVLMATQSIEADGKCGLSTSVAGSEVQ